MPGKYYVYDGNLHGKWLKEFKDQKPVLTDQPGEAMQFEYRLMAGAVAMALENQLGGSWYVFDIDQTQEEYERAKKLLQAIFSEDGDKNG